MEKGDKIQIITGKLKGLTGELMTQSKTVPGGWMCMINTGKGKEIKILGDSQIKPI